MEANLQHELATIRDRVAGGYLCVRYRRVAYTYQKRMTENSGHLGIPSLRDRIVERAMLMAMEPMWESDFHSTSYGFQTGT